MTSLPRSIATLAWFLGAALFLSGCSSAPIVNPSFDVSVERAEAVLAELRGSPEASRRPVLLVGGYFDPLGGEIASMNDELKANFGADAVLRKRYFMFSDFDRLRDQLIEAVDERFGPGDDPNRTAPVDAVALSMGGLVLRYAAVPSEGRRSLNLRRLYTVGTPHRGAAWATGISPDKLVRDMKAGSAFLIELESARSASEYELVPYVRLGDAVVGEENTSPPGVPVVWVDNLPWQRAHANAMRDPRIQADILLRLRGLPPLSAEPRTPLPE
ncbi:MAG: hypothetical protein AAGE65_13375 [Planctomycetota bacterium]